MLSVVLHRLSAYSSVSVHFPASDFCSFSSGSLPISPCQSVFVLHCSCLSFVFLPVSNTTYFLPSFSVNKSFHCLPPPPSALLPLSSPDKPPSSLSPSLSSHSAHLSAATVTPSLRSLVAPPCHSLSLNHCLDTICAFHPWGSFLSAFLYFYLSLCL